MEGRCHTLILSMKSHQKLSKASRYPNQILNQALPKYISESVYHVSPCLTVGKMKMKH